MSAFKYLAMLDAVAIQSRSNREFRDKTSIISQTNSEFDQGRRLDLRTEPTVDSSPKAD